MTTPLKANQLLNDPRVQEAKRLLIDAVKDHTATITAINPSPLDNTSYEALCSNLEAVRGVPLFYPYVGSGFGSGPFVELSDGSIKLDMIAGIGPHFFGHNYIQSLPALINAALEDTVMQGNLMHNQDSNLLAHKLAELSGLDHCFLTSSGAMACENALKILFQKHYPASRIITFEHCFIGRSLALSQITDKAANRMGLPDLLHIDYIPFYDHKRPQESIKATLDALELITSRYPGQHACICIELVQGEGGIFEGSSDFFLAIVHFLKAKNIGIYIDEVQTFARTESLFAYHLYGLQNKIDVLSIGKIAHACATLFTKEVAPKPGLLSQTFTASSSAIQATLWFLQHIEELNLYGHAGTIARLTTYFHQKLTILNQKLPGAAQGPYGRGGLLAFTPFDWNASKVTAFLKKLYHNGVIAFSAGTKPARVRMLPPLAVMNEAHIDQVLAIMEATIREEMIV